MEGNESKKTRMGY